MTSVTSARRGWPCLYCYRCDAWGECSRLTADPTSRSHHEDSRAFPGRRDVSGEVAIDHPRRDHEQKGAEGRGEAPAVEAVREPRAPGCREYRRRRHEEQRGNTDKADVARGDRRVRLRKQIAYGAGQRDREAKQIRGT